MKPFDLEKALAGEPVVTRGGLEVTEIHHIKTKTGRNVLGIVNGDAAWRRTDGREYEDYARSCDFVMAPKKRVAWVNFHHSEFNTVNLHAYVFGSEEVADLHSTNRIGKAHRIEIEE